MAVFVLSMLLICVQGYAQTHKAQKTSKGNNRPTASFVAPQEDSPRLQSEPQNNVEAEVRVVSTPAKDRYDKAAVWINGVLAAIGAVGIGFAIFTLRKLERQTKATEDSIGL